MLKDVARYGADMLLTDDNADFGTEALIDAAITAVMALAPEALPVVAAAAKTGTPLA